MSKPIKGQNASFVKDRMSPKNSTQTKTESFSDVKSASRWRRGLFDSFRGSQSSPNGRITRLQAPPYFASPRGPPLVGPNNQMIQSGSRNSLRNVIKNDVFKKYLFETLSFIYSPLYLVY